MVCGLVEGGQGATCGQMVEGLTLSSSGRLTPPAGGLRGFLHFTLPLGPLDSFSSLNSRAPTLFLSLSHTFYVALCVA